MSPIKFRFSLVSCLVVALLATFASVIPSCSMSDAEWEAQQGQITTLQGQIQAAQTQIVELTGDKNSLTAQIAQMKADLAAKVLAGAISPADQLVAETKIKDFEVQAVKIQGTIDKIAVAVDKGTSSVNAILESVKNAPTPEEGIAEGIRTGGGVLAPFAGPYAPLVLLGTNALAAILAAIGQRKRTTRQIVAPLEMARNDGIEAQLKASGQGDFLVIDKQTAAVRHAEEGIGSAIDRATKRVDALIVANTAAVASNPSGHGTHA